MIDFQHVEPPAVEVVVASDASRWGVGKNSEGVYVSGSGQYEFGPVYVGAEVNNSDYFVGADGEFVAFAGVTRTVAGIDLTATAEYRQILGAPSWIADDDAVEFSVTAARQFGPVRARATVSYAPDDFFGETNTWFVEGGAAYTFGKNEISGAVGRKEGGFANSEYTAWNVGYTRDLTEKVEVDFRYFETDQELWGEPFGDRYVATLRYRF